MFFEIGILKNFAMFTGKYLCWGLFLKKLQTFIPSTFLKRDSTQVFRVDISKFLRIPISKTIGCFLTVSMIHCYMGLKVSRSSFFYRTPMVAAPDSTTTAQ